MLCEAFIDEGVIAVQQIDHAAILADDAVKEQLAFRAGRLAEDCR